MAWRERMRRPPRGIVGRATVALTAALTLMAGACSTSVPRHVKVGSGAVQDGADGEASQAATVGQSDEVGAVGEPGVTGTGVTDSAGISAGAVPRGAGRGGGGNGHPGSPAASRGAPGTAPSGPQSSIGVTTTSVRLSVSTPLSGAYGALGRKTVTNAFEVWQAEVNANGGINGRKVVLVMVDNQYTAEGAIAACKQVQSNGSLMSMNSYGFTSEDDCEDAAGIPVFDIHPTYLRPWRNVFMELYTPLLASTQVSFLKSPYMNAAKKKIGIIYNGDAPLSASDSAAVAAELRAQGMKLVHTEKVANNQASFVSELSRLRNAGAEVVLQFVAFEGLGIMRDARAIGYTPQWYSGPNGTSADVIATACNELCRGIRVLREPTTTETPAFAAYVAKVRKYKGDTAARSADTIDMIFYSMSDIVATILRRAGSNLTRESVLAAAKSIDHYDSGMTPPFALKGRQPPIGVRALFPAECCKSDFTYKLLGPPREQF